MRRPLRELETATPASISAGAAAGTEPIEVEAVGAEALRDARITLREALLAGRGNQGPARVGGRRCADPYSRGTRRNRAGFRAHRIRGGSCRRVQWVGEGLLAIGVEVRRISSASLEVADII